MKNKPSAIAKDITDDRLKIASKELWRYPFLIYLTAWAICSVIAFYLYEPIGLGKTYIFTGAILIAIATVFLLSRQKIRSFCQNC